MFFNGMPEGFARASRSGGPVDTTLYDLLGVKPTSTEGEIKKVQSLKSGLNFFG